jgi:hypothetical protein
MAIPETATAKALRKHLRRRAKFVSGLLHQRFSELDDALIELGLLEKHYARHVCYRLTLKGRLIVDGYEQYPTELACWKPPTIREFENDKTSWMFRSETGEIIQASI